MAASTARRGRVSIEHGDAAPLRLVAYLRVSTSDQVNNGVSLDAQRERLAHHAKAHGYELAAIEADEGVSGKVPPTKRPGLRRALDMIKSGDADGIVCVALSRLSRSVRDILKLADDARRYDWHLLSISEHIDTSTAAGRMVLTVLAALSQMERELVGERTVHALDQIAREGRARSRFIPFGYRVDGAEDATELRAGDTRKLIEHEGEQRILGRIIQLHKHGEGMGARLIARHLNERGMVNPRTGRPWHRSTVSALLRTIRRRKAAMSV